ncbi:MAG: microcystin degradation protein MlrC [Planctomycetota bacterium]|nr:MAG: microcystin degradation protein MlrC [Planctomycetota bacterium]
MKIFTSYIDHETNTFSPIETKMDRFSSGEEFPISGQNALQEFKGTRSILGGFIDAMDNSGHDLIVGINAAAEPSGLVDDDAYQKLSDYLIEHIKGCDAIMLGLHGAMVTQTYEDGEGFLLERIRKEYPDIPIAISLDMHGNLYQRIIDNCNIISGYQTYPHIDMYDTSKKSGELLIKMLEGKCKPTMTWGNNPMIPHIMRQGSDDSPNKELQELCRKFEKEGALAVSVFTGFPHADIHNAGLSVVVVTDNDMKLAEDIKNELLDRAWSEREKFVYKIKPLSESVSEAKDYAERINDENFRPVLLLDHYDNTASGGTMESTEVLAEIIKQELEDVAFFGFHDPETVQDMIKTGVDNEIEVTLGGKIKIASLEQQTKPIKIKGTIKSITSGRFKITGPMGKGTWTYMGPSAVLSTDNIDIVIISRHIEPYDLGSFLSMGIDAYTKKFLVLKSRIHYRTCFMPIVSKVFECAGFGVCTSDYSQLTFKNLRRPIYPLDEISERYESNK